MSTIKKIMIGIGVVVALVLYIWMFNATKPSSDTDTEKNNINTEQTSNTEQNNTEIPKEIIKATDEIKNSTITDAKLQINGAVITFPIKVEDFMNQTGLYFSDKFSSEANEETNLRPLKETSAYMTSNGENIILVKIKNTSDLRIKNIKNCYIYGVNIAESTNEEVNNANLGFLYTIGGITYKDNYSDVKEYLNSFEWDKAVSSMTNNKIANYFSKDNYVITYFCDKDTRMINEIHFEIKENTEENTQTEVLNQE